MSYVEYNSNNSGGSWWLTDDDWKNLEKAGWVVAWANLRHDYTEKGDYVRERNGVPRLVPRDGTEERLHNIGIETDNKGDVRYMGALARAAYLPDCEDIRAAADSFDTVTSCTATDAGCACCGQPHNFSSHNADGSWIDSGPHVEYTCEW